ncbi:hypothetical protein LINPERPRIM_LOCUS36531 [Linum perenne]
MLTNAGKSRSICLYHQLSSIAACWQRMPSRLL